METGVAATGAFGVPETRGGGGAPQGPLQGQLRPPPRLSRPGLGPLLGPFELWALHRKHPFEKVAFTALSELSNTKLRR